MKMYHHAKCLFESFIKARATTKIVEDADDLENFSSLTQEDKDMLNDLIKGEDGSKRGKHLARAAFILDPHAVGPGCHSDATLDFLPRFSMCASMKAL